MLVAEMDRSTRTELAVIHCRNLYTLYGESQWIYIAVTLRGYLSLGGQRSRYFARSRTRIRRFCLRDAACLPPSLAAHSQCPQSDPQTSSLSMLYTLQNSLAHCLGGTSGPLHEVRLPPCKIRYILYLSRVSKSLTCLDTYRGGGGTCCRARRICEIERPSAIPTCTRRRELPWESIDCVVR
jgi:hypothetical protein